MLLSPHHIEFNHSAVDGTAISWRSTHTNTIVILDLCRKLASSFVSRFLVIPKSRRKPKDQTQN